MQPARIRFKPVELKARHDGWTAARQFRFIDELAATKSIARACRAVGMSRISAYKLRDRTEAHQFRLAWNAALRPDFDQPRKVSQRAAARLRRLEQPEAAKVDDVTEMNDPPSSFNAVQPGSSALQSLRAYLALMRAREDALAAGSSSRGAQRRGDPEEPCIASLRSQ